MTQRTHLPRLGVEPPNAVEPREQKAAPSDKPRGFWYEVDGDWRRWCESEQPDWIDGAPVVRVELGSERLLRIRNEAQLRRFTRTYGIAPEWSDSHRLISWRRVAAEYDGIEIAPYQWECRLDVETFWYYGWDCASGVIWRPRGVRLTPEEEPHD